MMLLTAVALSVGAAAWNLLVLAIGVFLLVAGYRWYSLGRLIRDTPTSKPGSVAAGRVEVTGTAQPRGDPIVAPFTGEECVYLDWRLERRDGDGDWETLATETILEPFYLEGERGRVMVCPDKHPDPEELPWEYDSEYFQTDGETPDAVEQVLQAYRRGSDGSGVRTNPAATRTRPQGIDTPPWEDADEGSTEWQFVKRLLPPGTRLYVFGSAELQYGEGEIGIEPDPSSGQFIINRASEKSMTEGAYWLGLLTFSAGLLFTLLGGAMAIGVLSRPSLWIALDPIVFDPIVLDLAALR